MAGRKKQTFKKVDIYTRPKILIRTREGKPKAEYDHDLAEQILAESMVDNPMRKAPPKGRCYICDKKIPPMRKLCGSCMSKREGEHTR